MILYKASDFQGKTKQKVESLVGLPYTIKEQLKIGFSGSSLFRLRESKLNNEIIDNTYLNLRCNFEKHQQGLIIRINKNQKLFNIAIAYNSIEKIFIASEHKFHLGSLNPIRLIIKLGFPLKYMQFLPHRLTNYTVTPLNLLIECSGGNLRFDSNGYNYRNTLKYFQKTILKEKIILIHDQ